MQLNCQGQGYKFYKAKSFPKRNSLGLTCQNERRLIQTDVLKLLFESLFATVDDRDWFPHSIVVSQCTACSPDPSASTFVLLPHILSDKMHTFTGSQVSTWGAKILFQPSAVGKAKRIKN